MLSWSRNGACSNSEPAQRQNPVTVRRGGAALALLCSVGAVVRAQDIPPGFVANFDITQRLEYSDNPDFDVDGDPDFFGRTVLGFGLESVTKVQALFLNLGTDIEEFRDDNPDDIDTTNPFANVRYTRNTRNALLGVSAAYRESDVSSTFFDEDFDLDGNVINQDSGTRESYSFGLNAEIGREAPIGASFDWAYNELTYSGTDDPDLTDQSSNDFLGQVDFRITPRITAKLTGKYIDFDTNGNGVDRKTTGLGAGVALVISPVLTADLSLSYDRIERSGDETGTDEGVSGDFGLTRALPNGSVGLRYASDVVTNDDGRRSYFAVTRDMELPRGALSFALGVTGSDTVGTDPLAELDYQYQLPTATVSVGLSQRVVTDDDNQEEINTTLSAGFDKRINSLSSLGVNFAYFNRNELGENPNDGDRIDVSLSYRYDLTRDWGLVSGISHAYATEDIGEDRRRTTVFVGLQRSFSWLP
jgi:hypothetical protein